MTPFAADRRLLAANGRVAHVSLTGKVSADRFVPGEPARLVVPVADLLDAPGGRRDRQMIWGERFEVLERAGGFAFGRPERDGYVGYLAEAALGPDFEATHWVSAPATHLYAHPDIKRGEVAALSLGSRLRIEAEVDARFVRTDQGCFAIAGHLTPVGQWAHDPAQVALGFVGTPYLWGGNSRAGIDCSGLVQAAHLACGMACPGDSDLQGASLGMVLAESEPLRRGDLMFWKGHVALCISQTELVHAVGFTMDVRVEPIAEVVARNMALGAGPVTGRRRI